MSNVLIIAPHPDDEVLGCFSFLEGATVIYITTFHPLYPKGENIEESKKLAKKMKFRQRVISDTNNQTNNINNFPISKLINLLEEYINELCPLTVLIPFPSYNQDHRAVYDASLTALRHHDQNHFVKRVLVYEQPETFDTMGKVFTPQYFRPIDINAKLGAIDVYTSQLRLHRSFNYIMSIAGVRGNQSNCDYAEAFEVLRWCE